MSRPTDLEQAKRDVANLRRRLTSAIKRKVAPHFRETGYNTAATANRSLFAPRRPMLGWFPDEAIELNGRSIETVIGITEHGPCIDAEGGGMVWSSYGCFPVEDLMLLLTWLDKNLEGSLAARRDKLAAEALKKAA